MKSTKTISFIISLFLSLHSWADGAEFNRISDLKKVLIQFMKPVDLQLSQFVRDMGRSRSTENKSPNYRLLFESAKLQGPEDGDARVGCTIYQKTMLSNRVKNYAEESTKLEKTITEKTPITLSSDIQWTVTKAMENEKGFMLWLSGEKKSMQINCEKKTVGGEEKQMTPKEVFMALAANEVRFFKDGSEMKFSSAKIEESAQQSASSDPTSASP